MHALVCLRVLTNKIIPVVTDPTHRMLIVVWVEGIVVVIGVVGFARVQNQHVDTPPREGFNNIADYRCCV